MPKRWIGGLVAPERLAVLVWGAVLLVILARVLVQPRSHSVYPIFANAGRNWMAARDLYTRVDPGLDHYRYSPLVAAAFAPLSFLSERAGNVLWRLLNTAVYLGALLWWAKALIGREDRHAKRQPWTATQVGVVFLLVLPLSIGNVNNGQSNALVLGLILAALAGVAEERWGLASACIAAACLFKVYPIAIGLLLTVVYPRRFGVRLTVALVLGAALPLLLQRPGYVAEQYAGWIRHVQGDDRQTWPILATYRDLRLLFRVWFVPLGARTYQVVQLLMAAVIAAVCFLRSRRSADTRETLLLLLALGCCWMTLFGSATESTTYILLAPALAGMIIQVWMHGGPTWARGMLLGSYSLFIVAQIANWFPFGTWFHSVGPQPLAALVFFVYVLIRAVRPEPAQVCDAPHLAGAAPDAPSWHRAA